MCKLLITAFNNTNEDNTVRICGRIGLLSIALFFGAYASAQDMIPLAVGNVWEFSADKSTPENRIEILEARKVGEHTWYKLSEFGDVFWVRNAADGQYEAGYEEDGSITEASVAAAVLFLPNASAERGLHRPWPDDPEMRSATMKYWKHQKQCQVPAGSFDCVSYEWTEDDAKTLWVIAPGVGVISYTYSATGDDPDFMHVKLLSYKLNQVD